MFIFFLLCSTAYVFTIEDKLIVLSLVTFTGFSLCLIKLTEIHHLLALKAMYDFKVQNEK